MFDYRYHAISLAAVLIALALGVLIGVAIGDSNLVSSAKSGIVRNLQSDLGSTRQQLAAIQSEQQVESTAQKDLYEIAVQNILASREIGLVFLGESSQNVDNLVRSAINQSGGDVASVVAIHEPLSLQKLAAESAGTRYQALAQTPPPHGLAKEFGIRMGSQLVKGGRLLSRVQGDLLSSFNGQFGALEGLVIMRASPEEMTPEQAESTTEFESGLIVGANQAGATTVGVELSTSEPSQVPWYKAQAISSVDDIDKTAGRAALALALAGDRGSWGMKPTADAPLPVPAQANGKP